MILLAHYFFQMNKCICQFGPENITKKSNMAILSNYVKSSDMMLAINSQL